MGGKGRPLDRDIDVNFDGDGDPGEDMFRPTSRTREQEGYGRGEATLTAGDVRAAESARCLTTEGMAVAATVGGGPRTGNEYPYTHPILTDLIKAGRNRALAELGHFLERPQEVGKDQKLTPIHGGAAPLRIPLAGQPITIDLFTIDRSKGTPQIGALVEGNVAVHEGHSIPTGAWFSGMETLEGGRVNIPPSFAASSTRQQMAYKLPPVADLIRDAVITPKDAVFLIKSATGEFSQWLAGANEHGAVKHPRFQPLAVSTFTEGDWRRMIERAEAKGGCTETLEPWRVVLPSRTGVNGPKLMVFNGRGYFIDRDRLAGINPDATIGRRSFETRDEKKALGNLPKLGMIQDGNGAGISTGYEYAAWAQTTPGALFVPTTRSEVLTIPIREDDIDMAVQAMKAIQLKNLLMTVHIGMQAQELGIKETPAWMTQVLDTTQKASKWFRRQFLS